MMNLQINYTKKTFFEAIKKSNPIYLNKIKYYQIIFVLIKLQKQSSFHVL
jgi:hypothetical protein